MTFTPTITFSQQKIWGFFCWCWCAMICGIALWGSVACWLLQSAAHVPVILLCLFCVPVLWIMTARRGRFIFWLGPMQFASSWIAFSVFIPIQQVSQRSVDGWLFGIDRLLWFGKSLPEWVLPLEAPWLSEVVSFCYFTFYFIILLSVLYFAWRRKNEGRYFFYGLMLMYLFGFCGYILMPAAGPYIAYPGLFPYPPPGGPMTQLMTHLVSQGSNHMDVFPSLHCGVTLYILGFHWRWGSRGAAWLILPLLLGMTLATLYLRYHYGIDLIAGVLLAAGVLAYIHFIRETSCPIS